ncbi:VanW family protein [Catenulispora rubra]|uniref:VanW family protein n=1 Tax=Catenulispora rubra TaxID=280293 RepID=UPI0018926592|nr:VanW family protein [Catenulispora rubra]
MNDEFPRRQADDVDPDRQPDYGFGGAPLFRDEVPPPAEPAFGAGPASVPGPGATGFHDASLFRDGAEPVAGQAHGLDYGGGGDYGTGIMSGFGGGADTLSSSGGFPAQRFAGPGDVADVADTAGTAGTAGREAFSHAGPNAFSGGAAAGGAGGAGGGASGGEPEWGPSEGPLRVVPADQASALLRIKLPDAPPVPSTTLRGDAAIEEVVEASQMLHRVSPAKATALPGDVLALTTATMVVPMPGAAFGGVRAVPRSARLTASVPPDLASRAEADLLSDTVEQFFGDFDAIGRELEAQRASGVQAAAAATVPTQSGEAAGAAASQPATLPNQYGPSAPPGGRYGVPTQVPGYEAARRSPVGMRYLGGIFHDSSGESSFYDPSTESLVPMGAAAISASDFRRTAPAVARPVPPPRIGAQAKPAPRTAAMPAPTRGGHTGYTQYADGADDTKVLSKVLPKEHWSDHHPDHHRSRRGRRRGRVALVSALSVTLACGALYGAALAFEGQVPKGTVVDGVAIGGMTRTAAEAKLSAALGSTLNAPLRLTADGTTFQLAPDQSGLHIDYAGTVAAAASGRSDPTVAIPALAGSGREVPLQVSVDRTALKTALTNLTTGFDKPMVDGSVVFPGGVPTPIAPRPGRQIDVDVAVDAVVSAFDNGVSSVHLASMAPAAPLPTAPVAYAMAPAKTELSPTHHTATSRVKQSPATPSSPSSTPSAPVSPSGTAGMPTGSAPAGPIPAAPAPAIPAPAAVPASAPFTGFPAPPVALAVHDIQPTVTPAAVAQAMQDFARPAMSGSVVLITGSVHTVLKPAILGRHLAIEPDGHGGLTPKLDGVGIRAELDHDALAKLEQAPTDASFTVSGGKPVLVPGKNGLGYAPEAIQSAVLPVLTKASSAQRIATVPIGPLPPAFTTEAAQALGVHDVMGLYTAPFSPTTQRTANVKRAADLVRGQILQPGQVFSLNQILGARTTANGFLPAAQSGTSTPAQDVGAGTSLVATALYNAEYLAGLKDVEHHPHATVTDHFPPGMEAAMVYPDVDLKFQNDSGAPVYLWTSSTENAVTVAVLGQKAYDSVQTETSPHYALVQPKTTYSSAEPCVAGDGVPGFQVDVTRTLTKSGQDPIRQVFHSSYAAQDKVICGAPGSNGASAANGATVGTPTGTPTGGAATPQSSATATQGTASSPNAPSPTGGAGSGTPVETPASSASDGSLLGGLLGAPSSRH